VETLYAVHLPPGLLNNGTVYESKNRWFKANLVRWHEGHLRAVGGWQLAVDTNGADIQVTGKPRGAHAHRKSDSTAWLSVGTQTKLYVYSAGSLTDITPGGLTAGVQDGSTSTGAGLYGAGPYGIGAYGLNLGAGVILDADTWQLDNFGEILIACLTSDGKLYESTPNAVATQVTNSPIGCRGVVVTPERFIFALGASSDPRNVAWCAQSARTVWTPTGSNSAGSFPLQTVGRLMAGKRTDRETLLWTDADLWAAVFIGGNSVYSFQRRGNNCGLVGPHAVTMVEGAAFWMGDGQFFAYDGAVRQVPCEVTDYVFSDLNKIQKAKITALPNIRFGEVWWFYPSASQSGLENDRYVMLNYRTGQWSFGTLARAAGVGADVFANPQLWASDGRLYSHEIGTNRQGQQAFIESGPLELGDGDRVLRLQSLVPDERTLGQVQARFYRTFYPMQAETLTAAYPLSAYTEIRESGRQFRLRLEQPLLAGVTMDSTKKSVDSSAPTMDSATGGGSVDTDFRIGDFRVGYIMGGFR
jgi:hypothetical protein